MAVLKKKSNFLKNYILEIIETPGCVTIKLAKQTIGPTFFFIILNKFVKKIVS